MQTKTAQLLVCIVVSVSDEEDKPDATQLEKWLKPRNRNNASTAIESKKFRIFNDIGMKSQMAMAAYNTGHRQISSKEIEFVQRLV